MSEMRVGLALPPAAKNLAAPATLTQASIKSIAIDNTFTQSIQQRKSLSPGGVKLVPLDASTTATARTDSAKSQQSSPVEQQTRNPFVAMAARRITFAKNIAREALHQHEGNLSSSSDLINDGYLRTTGDFSQANSNMYVRRVPTSQLLAKKRELLLQQQQALSGAELRDLSQAGKQTPYLESAGGAAKSDPNNQKNIEEPIELVLDTGSSSQESAQEFFKKVRQLPANSWVAKVLDRLRWLRNQGVGEEATRQFYELALQFLQEQIVCTDKALLEDIQRAFPFNEEQVGLSFKQLLQFVLAQSEDVKLRCEKQLAKNKEEMDKKVAEWEYDEKCLRLVAKEASFENCRINNQIKEQKAQIERQQLEIEALTTQQQNILNESKKQEQIFKGTIEKHEQQNFRLELEIQKLNKKVAEEAQKLQDSFKYTEASHMAEIHRLEEEIRNRVDAGDVDYLLEKLDQHFDLNLQQQNFSNNVHEKLRFVVENVFGGGMLNEDMPRVRAPTLAAIQMHAMSPLIERGAGSLTTPRLNHDTPQSTLNIPNEDYASTGGKRHSIAGKKGSVSNQKAKGDVSQLSAFNSSGKQQKKSQKK